MLMVWPCALAQARTAEVVAGVEDLAGEARFDLGAFAARGFVAGAGAVALLEREGAAGALRVVLG